MSRARALIPVLWPSFVVAGMAEGVFFTLFDPLDLHLLGDPVAMSPLAAYTVGFFAFWTFAAASSAFCGVAIMRSVARASRGSSGLTDSPLPLVRWSIAASGRSML